MRQTSLPVDQGFLRLCIAVVGKDDLVARDIDPDTSGLALDSPLNQFEDIRMGIGKKVLAELRGLLFWINGKLANGVELAFESMLQKQIF